ncbi:zinc finger protein Pegasus, partial [Silurus meridionalis]
MNETKVEPLDFVRDFQEYLDQQTHHVNALSSSVNGEKSDEDLRTGVCDAEHSVMDHLASVEVRLDTDGFERTGDGKFQCRYCTYASKGQARLIEHMRTHTGPTQGAGLIRGPFIFLLRETFTLDILSLLSCPNVVLFPASLCVGEKPHRCQLCPFSSAYERQLETHMRSHTGEKPYKCELCPFRCNDRSNLSHHRRRRHKLRRLTNATATQTKSQQLYIPDDKPLLLPQPPANQEHECSEGPRPCSPGQDLDGYERDVKGHALTPPSQDLSADALLSPESSPAQINARTLYFCPHCQTYFGDNVLYTVHMGCHGYDQPFQCNVCGVHCSDKYDFACHFAQGQHRK